MSSHRPHPSQTGRVRPARADGGEAIPAEAGGQLALVVEDLPDTRGFLADALGMAFPETEVRAVGTLDEARRLLARLPAAEVARLRLVLVDIGLPDGSGIDLIAEIAETHPQVMPIVTTIFEDDEHVFDAIAAGARGYLLKNRDADLLVRYLRRIELGEPPLSPSIARRIIAHFRTRHQPAAPKPQDGEALTPREAEVLSLLGRGSRVPEVAFRLGLTDQTVATYVKTIYRKLRISSRAEAALEAARRGLV
jgi:DNA-binding NarL/FixJ family response regulator